MCPSLCYERVRILLSIVCGNSKYIINTVFYDSIDSMRKITKITLLRHANCSHIRMRLFMQPIVIKKVRILKIKHINRTTSHGLIMAA